MNRGYLFIAFLWVLGSCKAPHPRSEDIRIPPVFSQTITAREGDAIDFLAVGAIPDPRYETDRLNPEKYKQTAIRVACFGSCPDAMDFNRETGKIAWQTGYDDAGVYRFALQASMDQPSGLSANQFRKRGGHHARDY